MLRYRKWSHTPLEDISGKIKFWWKNKIISAFFKINHSHWQLGLEAQFFYPIVIGNLAVPIFCFNFPVSFWDVCGLNYDSFHRLWHFLVWAWRGNAQPPVKLWCFSNVESRLVEFSRAHQYFLSKSFKTLTSSNSLLWDSFASTSFLITFKCFSLSGIDCAWMVTKQYWPLKDEFLEATPMHWSKSPSWLMLPFKAPLGNFAFASNTENLSIWEMAESMSMTYFSMPKAPSDLKIAWNFPNCFCSLLSNCHWEDLIWNWFEKDSSSESHWWHSERLLSKVQKQLKAVRVDPCRKQLKFLTENSCHFISQF